MNRTALILTTVQNIIKYIFNTVNLIKFITIITIIIIFICITNITDIFTQPNSNIQRMQNKLSWRPVTYKPNNQLKSKPCPRWGHSSCTIGKYVVLFGGYAQSIYMNDLWAFDTETMEWSRITTTGNVPSPRSNCSASYDATNNRILFFGGGGTNKSRFNSINILDWETKKWSEITYKENQVTPWERTYHTAQLLQSYLIIYGGQGITDLDDIWVFNIQTNIWIEIPIGTNQIKPCGRRFHSSCLIENQFYIIAGCHTKYRCLNNIYSIDLTPFLETGDVSQLEWKERSYKGTALLSRWGHSSTVQGNYIYIFGGRFSNDLNDLLIYDTKNDTLNPLKVSQQSLPKPRRRPSICFMGSCLLMFGGFNSEYYNDLYFINVGDHSIKLKNLICETSSEISKIAYIKQLQQSNKLTNSYIKSSQQQLLPIYRDLLSPICDGDQQKIDQLINKIDGKFNLIQLKKIMQILYLGYGKLNISCSNLNVQIPPNLEQKLKKIKKSFDERLFINNSLSCIPRNKNLLGVIQLTDQNFEEMIQKNRDSITKNVKLIINNQFVLESNSYLLSLNNQYFRSLFSDKYQSIINTNNNTYSISLLSSNIVLFEMLINYLVNGLLVIPQNMPYQNWIQMYEMADYFCFSQLKQLCIYQLSLKIDQNSIKRIFSFSQKQVIENLAEYCAALKIKSLVNYSQQNLSQKYMKKIYELNRFQIIQQVVSCSGPKLIKSKSEKPNNNALKQKQNYQICN